MDLRWILKFANRNQMVSFLGEWTDAGIVLAVVIGSPMPGFTQEYCASNAVEKLRSQVTIKAKGYAAVTQRC